MKTKVLTQILSAGGSYEHFHISILSGLYNQKDTDNLEIIGYITFQRNIGEPDWYGMRYKCDTDKARNMVLMSKIVNHVSKKRSGYDAQPDEILKLIGADDYLYDDLCGYVPVSADGKNIYNVRDSLNRLHRRHIASSVEEVRKKILKEFGAVTAQGYTIEFNRTIQLVRK